MDALDEQIGLSERYSMCWTLHRTDRITRNTHGQAWSDWAMFHEFLPMFGGRCGGRVPSQRLASADGAVEAPAPRL